MRKIFENLLNKLTENRSLEKSSFQESKEVDNFFIQLSSFFSFLLDYDGCISDACDRDEQKILYLPLDYVKIIREMVLLIYERSDDPIAEGYLSEGNLQYAIEYVKNIPHGNKRLSIEEQLIKKSAFILYNMVLKHPFTDGNKRTGIITTNSFLELNGYSINNLPFRESLDFITSIAKDEKSLAECEGFIRKNMVKLEEMPSDMERKIKKVIEKFWATLE